MRKASLEAGDSSGSDDGRPSLRGGHHQYARPGEDLALGLDKFPTFIPRNLQEVTGDNHGACGQREASQASQALPRGVEEQEGGRLMKMTFYMLQDSVKFDTVIIYYF